jgi:dephospho-CoA kinase
MIKLALTGSIGMGKSATAALFASRGIPVYDADAAVHAAYATGGEAVAPLEWAFPGVISKDGSIDRARLRAKVADDPDAMKKLESIVHPIVGSAQRAFLKKAEQNGADIVVLDIPLLFETGGDQRADAIVVVTSPPDVQRARVLARGQMTEEQFEAILARQTPDSAKRQRADFVINTGFGFPYAEAQVDAILEALRTRVRAARESTEECAKSSSIPKQPDSTPTKAIASSKLDASSS